MTVNYQGFIDFYNPNIFQYGTSIIEGTNIIENTTTSLNVENENRKYTKYLRENESLFLNILSQTDFEDGCSNPAIEYVENNLIQNSYATSMWLNELLTKYPIDCNNKEKSSFVQYGVLRIISFLGDKDYLDYIKGNLLLMIKVSLKSDINYVQEAALMVIESWRDRESLSLLNDVTFSDSLLQQYSDALKNEISDELNQKAV